MKKLIALAGIAVLTMSLSGVAIAQTTTKKDQTQKTHKREFGGHRHGVLRGIAKAKISEKLALTDAQKEKIRVLNQQFKAQIKGLKDSKGDRDAKKGQLKSAFQQHRQAILNVLTAEQKAKLEAMKKIRKGNRA